MTDTIDVVPAEQVPREPAEPVDQQQRAEQLLAQAKEQGGELVDGVYSVIFITPSWARAVPLG